MKELNSMLLSRIFRNLNISKLLLRIILTFFCSFTFSCFDILHSIKINKNEVSGQMYLILPRKMFGQEISEGNGSTSMDQKIAEMKKDPSFTSIKKFDVHKDKTESNFILSFLYSGDLKSEWKYLTPTKGDLSGFFIPYKDPSNQMIFISHMIPDKLNSQSMGAEFGEAMFKQFTYKLSVQSERKPKKAVLYTYDDKGDFKQIELPILGVDGNHLYILPIGCANGNCILVLSEQDKLNSKEPDRIANIIKSKLSDNYKELTRINDKREKQETEENKLMEESNKQDSNKSDDTI